MSSSAVYQCVVSRAYPTPYVSSTVHAEFPLPADDFLEGHLDLNAYLICHPAVTYYVQVKGESIIIEIC